MNSSDRKEKDIYRILGSLVLVGAFIVIFMISMLSEFGEHPDEYDVRACMDWAMNHFIWPDMRLQGTGLGDTYSLYGYTKMCNYTVYFLVMSKIALVFKLFMGAWPYYRIPNLLLALLMLIVCIRSLNSKRYVLLGFGCVAQAWYIFSYVTADALDFVLAFAAVYLLTDNDGAFWRLIRGEKSKKVNQPKCILFGILFGLMLLGKPYYYSVLVMIFIVLLIYLIHAPQEKRSYLWKTYICILLTACLIYAARAGLDLYYYGADKAAVEEEMMEIYANDDKKPSTPVEEQLQTYHAYEKGYPISFIFEDDPDWFIKSYRSFASARLTTEGDDWYFLLMAAAYIFIYVEIGVAMVAGGKKNEYSSEDTDKYAATDSHTVMDNRIIFAAGTVLIIGNVIASVLNSYLIDSQPQGRYLLPIPLLVCFMASRVPKLWKDKKFLTVVLFAACLSVMYFGLFDSRKLLDLAYIKSMLS